jgi:chaperone modulatory protein CbpM
VDIQNESAVFDEESLSLEQMSMRCMVSRDWVIEHVEAGVLQVEGAVLEQWSFSARQLLRARRLLETERRFEANPELAGLVVDLMDELSRLRAQLRRRGR